MTDTDLEQKQEASTEETVVTEENVGAEEMAGERTDALRFVELGHLIPEIQDLLGPQEQVVEQPKEEKKKPSRAKRF